MRQAKRFIKAALLLVIIFTLSGISKQDASAYTNKSQINKEIKKTTAKIKKQKTKVNAAKRNYQNLNKQYAKTIKGAITVIVGKVIYSDPVVIRYGNTYYYIAGNGSSNIFLGTYTGLIRAGSGYTVVNGITCRNASVIRNNTVYKKTKAAKKKYKAAVTRMENLQSKKSRLKKALVYKVSNHSKSVYIGDQKNLRPSYRYYNKITWKSSDPSIASINTKGVVTGKKVGTVTITAKTNISKKVSKISFRVKPYTKITFCEDYFGNDGVETKKNVTSATIEIDEDIDLWIKERSKCSNTKWIFSNPSVIKYEECTVNYPDNNPACTIVGVKPGETDVTLICDGAIATCHITVLDSNYDDLCDDYDVSSSDDD